MRLIALLALLCFGTAGAANKFVTPTGAGSNSGADWDNAHAGVPTTLTRGDVYYLADGSYGNYYFDDSGTTVITLRKCTTTDGVSSAASGYVSTLCDGQATFGTITVQADGLTVDGATRDESDWSDGAAYGLRITGVRSTTGENGVCAADLTVQYADMGGTATGDPPTGGVDQVFYVGGFAEYCQDWVLTRNYVHDSKTTYHMNGISGTNEISYSYIVNGWSKESVRGQIHASGMTIRHNVFKDSCQGDYTSEDGSACTGIIAMFDGYENSAGWANTKIYGNVFWTTNDASMQDAIIVVGGSSDNVSGVEIYNNTFAGFEQGNRTVLVRGTTDVCRNNLAWDVTGGMSWSCSTTSDNTNASSDPFVNYAIGDFRLDAATADGTSLSSPFNVDLTGATRGDDGVWDLGAYEFDSGAEVIRPEPPTNVVITQVLH